MDCNISSRGHSVYYNISPNKESTMNKNQRRKANAQIRWQKKLNTLKVSKPGLWKWFVSDLKCHHTLNESTWVVATDGAVANNGQPTHSIAGGAWVSLCGCRGYGQLLEKLSPTSAIAELASAVKALESVPPSAAKIILVVDCQATIYTITSTLDDKPFELRQKSRPAPIVFRLRAVLAKFEKRNVTLQVITPQELQNANYLHKYAHHFSRLGANVTASLPASIDTSWQRFTNQDTTLQIA